MAKIASDKAMFFAIAIFAVAASPSFAGSAFADDPNGLYSHSHTTALWDPNLVCGNHICVLGEMPQHPSIVIPVKGIK
jgi:hypothetical protein